MEAKGNAAESALKYIVKNRRLSTLMHQTDQADVGDPSCMEVCEDRITQGAIPWQHVASFALFKLLNTWGDVPLQITGKPGESAQPPSQNRPARKIPDNAAAINPLMLMNQVLPHAQFDELERTGIPPIIIFSFKCTVDGESFVGSGPNKKLAKKMSAFAACSKILNIEYPPDVYSPVKVQVE